MAKRIYEEEQFTLMSGEEVTVRPLPIKPLRKFMEKWEKIQNLGTEAKEVDLVDIMFDCAVIVVETFNDHVTEADLEDSLDMKTMEKILSIGGGIMMDDSGDPKRKV